MHSTWSIDANKILTTDEILAVVADLRRTAGRSKNTRMNLTIFRLACSCGLRVSEIIGLRISDFKRIEPETDKPFISIRRGIAKGGKARTVPLWWDRESLVDIKAWRKERLNGGAKRGDFLVCALSKAKHGKQLSRRNARNRFRSSCRVLGEDRLKGLTIHHGRHSFVSHALHVGRPIAAVRDAAGHSSIATTNVYAHVLDQDDKPVGDLYETSSNGD